MRDFKKQMFITYLIEKMTSKKDKKIDKLHYNKSVVFYRILNYFFLKFKTFIN